MTGYSYRCVVSGTCTPSVTSSAATLTVRTLPAIGTHPSNVTLCAGATATFSVAATGAGLTYQWQENTGSGFVNMVNTTAYFNVTTPTLSIVPAAASMNNYQYRCVVSGTCSPSVTSNAATLTVNTAPAITTQPAATIICSGANTSYSVTATGTALTYQWQLSTNSGGSWSNLSNTGVYSNVTTNTMNITAATAGMTGSLYRCVISGTCAPAATTFAASLTVNTPPAIGTQPSNVTVCANGNISFTVGASGTALTYQWQQDAGSGFVNLTNGGAVTGATSATLNIVAVTTAMNNYNYRCVVSGTCTPSATSNNALLTVNPMITPSVSIAASATTICSGTSVTFTATPTNGGTTPVYVWKRGTTTVGTNSPTYTAANFLNGEVVTCQMTSNAACITTATVASNAVTMNVTQSVTPSLQITTPNNPVCSNSTVVFTAVPTNGGSSPAYQWRKNGNPVGTGAVTYTDNTLVNGDIISCVLTSNAVCATTTTANSNNITMGINPIVVPAITISTGSEHNIHRNADEWWYIANISVAGEWLHGRYQQQYIYHNNTEQRRYCKLCVDQQCTMSVAWFCNEQQPDDDGESTGNTNHQHQFQLRYTGVSKYTGDIYSSDYEWWQHANLSVEEKWQPCGFQQSYLHSTEPEYG
jgi:hypothetical protein